MSNKLVVVHNVTAQTVTNVIPVNSLPTEDPDTVSVFPFQLAPVIEVIEPAAFGSSELRVKYKDANNGLILLDLPYADVTISYVY